MTSESDSQFENPGRDWSKLMWIGLALVIAVMLIVLFKPQRKVGVAETRSHAWHILLTWDGADPELGRAQRDLTIEIRQRIMDGESFEKLAREYSEDLHSGSRGGDLGWTSRGDMVDQVEEYIWAAPLNQISEVIQSTFGFHIIRVTAREFSDAELYERKLHERVLEDNASTEDR